MTREEWLLGKYQEFLVATMADETNWTQGLLICVQIPGKNKGYFCYRSGLMARGIINTPPGHRLTPKVYMPKRCAELMKLALFPEKPEILFW